MILLYVQSNPPARGEALKSSDDTTHFSDTAVESCVRSHSTAEDTAVANKKEAWILIILIDY